MSGFESLGWDDFEQVSVESEKKKQEAIRNALEKKSENEKRELGDPKELKFLLNGLDQERIEDREQHRDICMAAHFSFGNGVKEIVREWSKKSSKYFEKQDPDGFFDSQWNSYSSDRTSEFGRNTVKTIQSYWNEDNKNRKSKSKSKENNSLLSDENIGYQFNGRDVMKVPIQSAVPIIVHNGIPLFFYGRRNLLVGYRGSRKSLVVLHVVIKTLKDGGAVAYFDGESGHARMHQRLNEHGIDDDSDLMDRFIMLNKADLPHIQEINTLIRSVGKPGLVVFDSFSSLGFADSDLNHVEEYFDSYINSLSPTFNNNEITREINTESDPLAPAVIGITHPAKSESDDKYMTAYGSQVSESLSDYVYTLLPKEGYSNTHQTKDRDYSYELEDLMSIKSDFKSRTSFFIDFDQPGRDEFKDNICRVMDFYVENDRVTVEMFQTEFGSDYKCIEYKIKKWLMKKGYVIDKKTYTVLNPTYRESQEWLKEIKDSLEDDIGEML